MGGASGGLLLGWHRLAGMASWSLFVCIALRITLLWSLSTYSALYRGKNISINIQRDSKTQSFWKTLIFSRILGHFPATTTASTRICRSIPTKHHTFSLLQTHQRSGKFQTRQFF